MLLKRRKHRANRQIQLWKSHFEKLCTIEKLNTELSLPTVRTIQDEKKKRVLDEVLNEHEEFETCMKFS